MANINNFRIVNSDVLRVIYNTSIEPLYNATQLWSRGIATGPVADGDTIVFDLASGTWIYGDYPP